jgi:DNA-binding MarR family transcriptional regulator
MLWSMNPYRQVNLTIWILHQPPIMSTMPDKLTPQSTQVPAANNIRGLLQDLNEQLEARSNALRQNTPYADVRPSDAKAFMLIARHPRSLSDLGLALGISRQAAHESVHRLVEMGIVALQSDAKDARVKIAHVTPLSKHARAVAFHIVNQIEEDIQQKIGDKKLEQLRSILEELTQS